LGVTDVVLSILIPTVIDREAKLSSLLRVLGPQVACRSEVELLVLPDARQMPIGDKRNRLVELASGEYVVFVDDDDAVTTDYVPVILNALATRPDVVCFPVLVRGHGREKLCRYHPSFTHSDLPQEYRRKPNHLMVWRRELVSRTPFPSLRFGEDTAWAEKMALLAGRVAIIDRSLYTYQFDPRDNATTGKQ
jgi:glycosyltransferase involved in cell wall biosynthesis